MREMLTRKLGPLPVWMWFLLFVLAGVVYFRYRQGKSSSNMVSQDNPNLVDTSGQSVLQFVAPDVFVNVQQPTNPATSPVVGPSIVPPHRTPRGPVVIGIPPPRRVRSVTYPAGAATDNSTMGAVAAQHNYRGNMTTRTAQPLVRNQ